MQLRRLVNPESVVEGEEEEEAGDRGVGVGVDGGEGEGDKGEDAGTGKRKASSRIQSVKRRKVGQGHEESEEVLPSGYRHDVRTFLASLFRCVFCFVFLFFSFFFFFFCFVDNQICLLFVLMQIELCSLFESASV